MPIMAKFGPLTLMEQHGHSIPPLLPPFLLPLFFVFLELDMDGAGNAAIVWWDQDATPDSISAATYDAGTATWSAPVMLTDGIIGGQQPQIAYSESGTAVAVWNQESAAIAMASIFTGTWSAGVVVGNDAGNPLVGVDAAGNSLIVWIDSVTNEITYSYNLGVPATIPGTDAQNFSFEMSQDGTAVVAWIDSLGDAYYSNFIAGTWSAPIFFNSAVGNIAVTMDRIGNTLIVFNNLSAYKPSGGVFGPSAPTGLFFNDSGVASFGVALSDNGRGFLTTQVPSGEGQGVEGTYTLFAIAPPIITGEVCSNKFATQTDCVHIVSWIPSADPAVVAYYLRMNGALIAIIPASGPFTYINHNQNCRRSAVYSLTAVNSLGEESVPAVIIL